MITILDQGGWLANLSEMSCKNLYTGMELFFKQDRAVISTGISSIPKSLAEKEGLDSPYIKHQRMAGEAVFLKAYISSQLEKRPIQNNKVV
jgi:hypothetical protein